MDKKNSTTSEGLDHVNVDDIERRRAHQELSMVETAVDNIASVADRIVHPAAPEPLSETAKEFDHVQMSAEDRRMAQQEVSLVEHAVDAIAAAADKVLHPGKKH